LSKKAFEQAAATGVHLIAQVKANQPALHHAIAALCDIAAPLDSTQTADKKRRCRDETRTVEVFAPGDSLADTEWDGHIRAVIRVNRDVLTRSATTGLWRDTSETALFVSDVVLPAASTYEKDGTLTNTAGEVQMTHRSIDPQGPRSDFDLIRILSHQLGMLGVGAPIRLRTPEAAFDEIRQNVHGYDLPVAGLLAGGAELSTATCQAVEPSYETPAGLVFSSNDFLFSSGTLGRYCSKLKSTNEAKDTPWNSSPSIQSWWYR